MRKSTKLVSMVNIVTLATGGRFFGSSGTGALIGGMFKLFG